MKLAILGTRGIPAQYGGFETFAEQLATRLARMGVAVTVFCPTDSPQPETIYRGVTLKFLRSRPLGQFSELFWDVDCFWAARRGFDVVYMLGVGAGFAAWIPRMFGTVVWINSDGIEWKRSKWSLAQRVYLALAEGLSVLFASRIVADAEAIANYLRARYRGLRQVSTVAYGANLPIARSNHALLDEWDLQPNDYYLIVCRLEPENYVLEIIEGFIRSKSSVPIVVLGNITNPNNYVRKLLAHRSDQVRFLGTVYEQDKLEALRVYAKAYMHGHSVGGTNPSLLEAMACSNLVIAHDNPFNREVLGEAGLYFTTSEQLTSIVNAVNESRVDAEVRRQRAVDTVRSRYRWDQIADAYFELLCDAVNLDAKARLGDKEADIFPPESSVR
jgi:glycosyltransferase involved in cell wall biosynthesis